PVVPLVPGLDTVGVPVADNGSCPCCWQAGWQAQSYSHLKCNLDRKMSPSLNHQCTCRTAQRPGRPIACRATKHPLLALLFSYCSKRTSLSYFVTSKSERNAKNAPMNAAIKKERSSAPKKSNSSPD